MSFWVISRGGDTDVDALLCLAAAQEFLALRSCCTIIILQWIISQSFHFARQSQAVKLTQTLTKMPMWCQTAWLKYFLQGRLTCGNLCENRGLQFSTLLFWGVQRKHISLHSQWLSFNFRINERTSMKGMSAMAYIFFGKQSSSMMSGQCSVSDCLDCTLVKEKWRQ